MPPAGGGKVPINPDYVEKITDDEVIFRNYEGRLYRYPAGVPLATGSENEADAAVAGPRGVLPRSLIGLKIFRGILSVSRPVPSISV
jgi:hypothetical protein